VNSVPEEELIAELQTKGRGPEPPVQLLDPDSRVGQNLQCTPDGAPIVYPIRENGAGSLWLQPLRRKTAVCLTSFQLSQHPRTK